MKYLSPTRRGFLTGVGTAALSAPYIIRSAQAQQKEVYVNTWGGNWTEAEEIAFFKPFTEETGIEIKTVAPVSYAKLKAQVEMGTYEWDVSGMGVGEWIRAAEDGLAEPLDYSIIDESKLFEGAAIGPCIQVQTSSTSIMYRTDMVENAPKDWKDFWDVENFPGERAMNVSPSRMILCALYADGVRPEDIYPADVDRAFNKLDEIKDHIKIWWTQGNQSMQIIRDGEVAMTTMWSPRGILLIREGLPAKISWKGQVSGVTGYGVAKGAPNRESAMRLVEFMAGAKAQADFAKVVPYGPSNPNSYDHIPDDIARELNSHPDNMVDNIAVNFQWEADNNARVRERFLSWQAS
jgi:putative spermidine/putrescine transport system substrate-binding protein